MAPYNPNRNSSHKCPYCATRKNTRLQLDKHINDMHRCYRCQQYLISKVGHYCPPFIAGRGLNLDVAPFTLAQSSLDGVFARYQLDIADGSGIVEEAFKTYYREIVKLLIKLIELVRNAKIRFVVSIEMQEMKTMEIQKNFFTSDHYIYRHKRDIKVNMFKSISNIVNTLNLFVMYGSSWNSLGVTRIDCYVAQIKPIRIGHKMPLPPALRNKRGIVNIKAPGNLCFHYSVICAYLRLRPVDNPKSLRHYKVFERQANANYEIINWESVSNPAGVEINDLDQFERDNQNFSINVYELGDNSRTLFPIRTTENEKPVHVNLLRVKYEENESDVYHFIFIRDLSMFTGRMGKHKRWYCYKCMISFNTEAEKVWHTEECPDADKIKVTFPRDDFKVVKSTYHAMPLPLYVVADFETRPELIVNDDEPENNYGVAFTKKESALRVSNYAYVAMSGDGVEYYKTYFGEDADEQFILDMRQLWKAYSRRVSAYSQVMRMNAHDVMTFISSRLCCICKKPLATRLGSHASVPLRPNADNRTFSPSVSQVEIDPAVFDGGTRASSYFNPATRLVNKNPHRIVRHHRFVTCTVMSVNNKMIL
jgi:hypothetical protein